ncbi:hypothetical protein PC129_g22105 [Phytophthora cactorum]|uniref:Uncharacterized protein n=1 Tax=Phytophthora cactorum TaxID=29920 RepID=A0A329RBD2_9STRA|nr:hypothetical protein Pcac1_g15950 [Phytophthora cactorum]KAG2875191.1 hypothetical protein PC114_g24870 [Phytophthora cactorum]KAG2936252.1 hypothetical protein PC117_g12141 [Phytophthora cactorum]KAG2983640.1 hypothetical protein PC120_g24401 [Phytophthora cactorum]KAG3014434.1 hypothetical protein PC119_g12160 [Phytophthora cactorum]
MDSGSSVHPVKESRMLKNAVDFMTMLVELQMVVKSM